MLRSVSGICYSTLCDLIPLYNGMISVPSRLAAVPVRWVYLKRLSPFLFSFLLRMLLTEPLITLPLIMCSRGTVAGRGSTPVVH
jgi:hypothetical protein